MNFEPARWHVHRDTTALQQHAVEMILHTAQASLSQHNRFHIVLAGGTTPQAIYAQLRHAATDWQRWHIYFGDERCVALDHPDRNSRMAERAWLRHVPIPATQIHVIAAEKGPVMGAQEYAQLLGGVGPFDLVLLGLGEDGHTASLFPGQDWGTTAAAPAALPVRQAPKPPPERVSLSAWRLGLAHQVIFLVAGDNKRSAVDDWRAGKTLPAAAIRPAAGADILVTRNCYT